MSDTHKIMSLSAIGLDSPGLVSKITTRVFEMNGNILDVEETCRRGLFSIFLTIDFSSSDQSYVQITDSLKSLENETGLKVILETYDEEELTDLSPKKHHIVNILGVDQPGIIAKVSSLFHTYNINIENCTTISRGNFFSMELLIDTNKMITDPSMSDEDVMERMKGELKDLCKEMSQSVVIQSEDIYKRYKKLVVFDVESTLIQERSLKNFLDKIKGKVKSMNGSLEFRAHEEDEMQTLVANAKMLKGFPARDFEAFGEILQLNPGTVDLVRILKSMGFKIALLSSGFSFFIKKIFEEAGVDYAFSNTLKVDQNGIFTGELEEPVITNETKEEMLEFIMTSENISRDQVIAVGDGSVGSHFIENAGLSIAFKPDETSINTDGIFSSGQIINMLYCLGIPKTELDKYLNKNTLD